MKIGFDLDKVFIDYPPFFPSGLFDRLYKKKDPDVLLYRIPNYPEQLGRKLLHLPFLRPPIKKNLTILRNIPKSTNKLYLISSRYKFLKNETNRLVKKHQLNKTFDALYFNFTNKQPHLFKEDVLNKLKLDIYIDDDLSLLQHVAKSNPKTMFYWLNYANKEIPSLPKNITAITQLKEIFTKNKK